MFGRVIQVDSKINKEGIGLGLHITKQIVTQMNGVITVTSKEKVGTKFLVTVPVTQVFVKVPDRQLLIPAGAAPEVLNLKEDD